MNFPDMNSCIGCLGEVHGVEEQLAFSGRRKQFPRVDLQNCLEGYIGIREDILAEGIGYAKQGG